MNDELQQKLIELLGSAEAFAVETAPNLVQDQIRWAQVQWVMPTVVAALLIFAACVMARRFKAAFDLGGEGEAVLTMRLFGALTLAIFGLTCACVAVAAIDHAIHATVAPYSYIVHLATGG